MLRNEIIERVSVWEKLQKTTLPICVYGMGDGAQKLIRIFEEYGIEISEFFASDEFVRGHSFCGYKVKKLSDILAEHEQIMIVVAFASQLPDVMDRVKEMHTEHQLVVPDMPVVGEDLFTMEYFEEHYEDLSRAYELMADDVSRRTFVATINYKISGDPKYLFDIECGKDEIFTNVLCLGGSESYVDLGAYRGDTIDELLHYSGGEYARIWAMEPDAKTYKKLVAHCEGMQSVELHNIATWDKEDILFFDKRSGRNSKLAQGGKVQVAANSVDNITGCQLVSYIKMDIEGAEKEGLCGAEKTISAYCPKLNIAGYHRTEDLFAIPLQIHRMCADYKIYLRHHPYFPAWDNNFYCVK